MRKRLIYIILGLLVALFIVLNGFTRIYGESFAELYNQYPSGKITANTAVNDPM